MENDGIPLSGSYLGGGHDIKFDQRSPSAGDWQSVAESEFRAILVGPDSDGAEMCHVLIVAETWQHSQVRLTYRSLAVARQACLLSGPGVQHLQRGVVVDHSMHERLEQFIGNSHLMSQSNDKEDLRR